MWKFTEFGSGTQIVELYDEPNMPYYYVHAMHTIRRDVSIDLAIWLNYGREPLWASSLSRSDVSDCIAIGEFDINITATGPMVMPEGGNFGDWVESRDPVHIAQRKQLIDRLLK